MNRFPARRLLCRPPSHKFHRRGDPLLQKLPCRLRGENLTSSIRSASLSWQDAVSSRIALKPISVHEGRSAWCEEEEDNYEPGPYQLAKAPRPLSGPKPGNRPAGILKSSYRGGFRKLGKLLRWINETAYGISILFLMMACVGFAMWVYENADSRPSEPLQQSKPVRGLGQIEAELAQAGLPGRRNSRPPNGHAEVPQPTPKIKSSPMKQNRLTIAGITGIVVLNFLRSWWVWPTSSSFRSGRVP